MVLGSKRGGWNSNGNKRNNEMNRNEPFEKEVFLAGILTPVHSIWTRDDWGRKVQRQIDTIDCDRNMHSFHKGLT